MKDLDILNQLAENICYCFCVGKSLAALLPKTLIRKCFICAEMFKMMYELVEREREAQTEEFTVGGPLQIFLKNFNCLGVKSEYMGIGYIIADNNRYFNRILIL